MRTANSLFSCDQIYLGQNLDDHVNNVHQIMSKKCNWGNKKLLIGMFGYDNIAMSIGYVFRYCPDMLNINTIAAYAHKGWADNYIYWRDNQPWLSSRIFKKPHNALNDDRRNKLVLTKFNDLTGDDRETNIIIANYILDLLTPKNDINISIREFLNTN